MDLLASGLENALVRLEPIAEEHWPILTSSAIEEAVWKWMPALPGGTSLRHYFDALLYAQKCGQAATFVLFHQSDGAFAGVTGLSEINKIHRRLRSAFAWHPPELTPSKLYQAGQLAMIQRAYDWRAKRLEWQVNPNNRFIMTELGKIGPTEEASFRNFERTADGIWVDKTVYSITRAEMPEAIQRLEQALV
ncbi:MAG: GNAT family protein [Pseudomonadota bacterium]